MVVSLAKVTNVIRTPTCVAMVCRAMLVPFRAYRRLGVAIALLALGAGYSLLLVSMAVSVKPVHPSTTLFM